MRADVVVGEGQALGTALSFGGPTWGCSPWPRSMCAGCRVAWWARRSTLRDAGLRDHAAAREQDIRREKATSNVCTNQTLMAVYAAVQLGWLGTSGLREVALRCARGTRYCREALLALDGVEPVTGATATFREFAVRTPIPGSLAIERLADEGYLGGLALSDLVGDDGDGSVDTDDAVHGLLIAVTERRTRAEVDGFVRTLDKVVR